MASNSAAKVEQQAPAEQQAPQSPNDDLPSINWDSEIQLVSSLAKLQELERKVSSICFNNSQLTFISYSLSHLEISLCSYPNSRSQIHELRRALPARLLEPLIPISNPNASRLRNSVAESPPLLRGDLEQAARHGLADIAKFQSMWRSPELKPVWAHVEARAKASNGQFPQPTGMWEKDYDVLHRELVKAKQAEEEERQLAEENAERAEVQSSEGEWEAVVERFIQKGAPGVRVIKEQDPLSLVVALAKAGIVLLVKGVKEADTAGVSEWQVFIKSAGRGPTKMETSILECLKSRPRKWDLGFLLVRSLQWQMWI